MRTSGSPDLPERSDPDPDRDRESASDPAADSVSDPATESRHLPSPGSRQPGPRMVMLLLVAIGAGLLLSVALRRWRDASDPAANLRTYRLDGPLHTETVLYLRPVRGVDPDAAANAAFDAIRRVHRLMNAHDDASDLGRIHASPPGTTVPVDPLTWQTLLEAMRYHRLSGGAFDCTVGPILALYDWKGSTMDALPDDESREEALRRVGSEKLLFEREGMRVGMSVPGMRIDLGGIAKGVAVDVAVEALQRHGIRDALVNAGGEIRMIGSIRPDQTAPLETAHLGAGGTVPEGIPIRIEDPGNPIEPGDTVEERAKKYLGTHNLTHPGAIATSGNYRRYVEIGGVRYSHIVDPRTGLPMAGGVIAATVVSRESCTQADAISTILSVMAPEEGRAFLALYPEVEAYLVTAEGELIHFRPQEPTLDAP